MLNVSPSPSDAYLAGGTSDDIEPGSHAALHGATCRRCGRAWPCEDSSGWEGGHLPSLIPNGALVSAAQDLDRLISWAPAANCPVVLDRYSVAWILFADEDGETHAGAMECPEDGVPARYSPDDLAADRGPLYVVFNGDYRALTGREQELCACCPSAAASTGDEAQ